MGMGINHWEWEGMGLKRYSRSLTTAQLYIVHLFIHR